MNIDILTTFIVASATMIFIPGPTTLLVAHYALMHGKKIGRYTVPAVALGDIAALVITFSGISALVQKYPDGLFFLKIIGGIYLCFLGLMAIFKPQELNDSSDDNQHMPIKKIFIHMLIITALNPESIFFLLAFFSQFIDSSKDILQQLVILGSVYVFIGASSSIVYTLAADKIRIATRSAKFRKAMNLITGTLLNLFGILIIYNAF